MKLKSTLKREPVVVSFVLSAAALATLFGLNVENELLENLIDWGSAGVILWQLIRARGKVTPLS